LFHLTPHTHTHTHNINYQFQQLQAEILSRLDKSLFAKISFGDDLILNSPIEEWPLCDVLIAFYSNGYPLEKVEAFVKLRKPFVLNDLNTQRVLKDRRRVYDLLEASGIDVPRHVFMNRDGYVSTNHNHCEGYARGVNVNGSGFEDGEEAELMEHDDHIEVNGVVIHKPFVEKPVDADDHNIAIYYPSSAGGGCKKLFRKVGDRSSEFYPDINEIRREGSYIYEEFVETQGTDVKMYTVGPDYGHAEARKSPAVDGKVERNEDGKEVRFPVILTLREKEIARRIVIVFKQYVCGFDLLRVQEGDSLVSYVCDVNGWSFVKNSRKYYDDCAQILTEHMLAAVKPKALHGFSALDPLMKICRDNSGPTPRRKRRSKAFVRAVSGQTDSCPPSPVKESENDNMDNCTRARAATLEDGALPVRDMPDMLINIAAMRSATNSVNGDDDATQISVTSTEQKASTSGTHQEELRCVIAVIRHGDRTPKQKLKVNMSEPLLLDYFHKHSKNCKKDLKIKAKKPMTEFLRCVLDMIAQKEHMTTGIRDPEARNALYKLRHMRDVLERWKIGGLNRKLQLKPRKWDEFLDADGKKLFKCAEVQLILKWGGNLTKLGEKQAISLGERFRNTMYPKTPGGGILRLHSTFRHDMKIKTSDEGRVMKTAAAFAKGFLELEGSIPPILVSLVHKEKDSLHMLDPSGNKEVKAELEACKFEVNRHLQRDLDVNSATKEEIEAAVGPNELTSITRALCKVKNPRKALFQIRATIGELLEQLDDMLDVMASDVENKHEGGEGLLGEDDDDEALSGIKLYKGETLLELTERWRLLHTKLYDEDIDEFDLSRVPDVHDNVRFDMLHNPHLGLTSTLRNLYNLAKIMADCVVPQEYGTAIDEKRSIGNKMCHALLDKIKYDLIIARTDNQVDMRYMINLDYSADLPINTMGRRVRTRLYFTSESHLHTLLNVLRFPSKSSGGKKSPLSRHGLNIIGTAPELCYLTQVVIRLFENTNKEPGDPKVRADGFVRIHPTISMMRLTTYLCVFNSNSAFVLRFFSVLELLLLPFICQN
jgi:inositol hexakisphosphate/diphosphoinositol-pentakisphosphate kinase